MSFNELNSVEHFIIHTLTGVNLNNVQHGRVKEDAVSYGHEAKWKYVQPELLPRDITEVFVEKDLKEALIRLNPAIAVSPERAEEVIHKLRAILITVGNVGLVRANEEFARWLKGEITMPIGKNHEHVAIRLIDFEELKNNSFILTNQFKILSKETKIPDIVMFVNGIPLVVGEAKTPVRPAVSWFDAAHDIHVIYENTVPQLFVPNVFSFATEGKELFIGGVRTALDFWAPWRIEDSKDELINFAGLQDVAGQLTHLLKPETLLDILQNFTVYATNNQKKKIKIVCRYQQYVGANAIVSRVVEGRIKKGLIWHFQGSGKSLLMLFAAQKLRKQNKLGNPTVIILVDRVDLDTQITATFNSAEVPNMITTESIKELHDLLENDTRKIIITMVHKFKEAYPDMNKRENIIVMVDEAHRTQEGDLGRKMRSALPNAFLFGLTGTPINKADKNTFWAFGAQTTALIHEHIHVKDINQDMAEMVLDGDVITNLMNKKDPKEAEKILKILTSRLGKRKGNPLFKQLSERLEALRDKAEKGLINSIEFIKHLCELAKETLRAEKHTDSTEQQKSAKSALTELFLEMKTDKTPAIVERIVNDIDGIVRLVRFDGWQNTIAGEREVQKSLRKTLLKYQLHKNEDLFNRAYEYIREYY